MSMIAVGPPGSLLASRHVHGGWPSAHGHGPYRPHMPVGENVAAIAEAFERTQMASLLSCSTARGTILIEEVRAAGARIN